MRRRPTGGAHAGGHADGPVDQVWAPPTPPTGAPQFGPLAAPRPQLSTRTVAVIVFAVVTTGAAYWGFLGWDVHRDVDPVSGRLTGPYQPWQVVSCGAVAVVVAAVCGWLREVERGTIAVGATLVASFAISGFTDPMNDGLWVVGAGMLAAVAFPAAFAVAAAARMVRNAAFRRPPET